MVLSPVLAPSLRGYGRGWLGRDVVAGLTVWAVLVPEALAYAPIAGVSPVVGLYAAPPALVFYAMFGSSRRLRPAVRRQHDPAVRAAVAALTPPPPADDARW